MTRSARTAFPRGAWELSPYRVAAYLTRRHCGTPGPALIKIPARQRRRTACAPPPGSAAPQCGAASRATAAWRVTDRPRRTGVRRSQCRSDDRGPRVPPGAIVRTIGRRVRRAHLERPRPRAVVSVPGGAPMARSLSRAMRHRRALFPRALNRGLSPVLPLRSRPTSWGYLRVCAGFFSASFRVFLRCARFFFCGSESRYIAYTRQ